MKLLVWAIASLGLGVSLRFAIPSLAIAIITFAQTGTMPDFSFKELASLGGFVVFAAFMAWLYVKERRENREEREKWMQAFQEHSKAIERNTAATTQQTMTLQSIHRPT